MLVLILLLFIVDAKAQSDDHSRNMLKQAANRIEFIENKGQIADQNGKVNHEVLFIAEVPGGAVYVRRDGISFAMIKRDSVLESKQRERLQSMMPDLAFHEDSVKHEMTQNEILEPVPMEIYRVDMQFNNSLKSAKVTGLEMTEDYNNYYLAQCPDGITNVRIFRRVYFENIYNNIDFVLYQNSEGKVQYDFIVNPGGNPDDINFKFDGAENVEILAGGSLKVGTPLGNIEQAAPYSYQSQKVESSFQLNKDKSISFAVGSYDKSQTLIIDPPTRLWGTYYGGTGIEHGRKVTCDGSGNVYLSGETASSNTIATSGSHQEIYGGGSYDAFLVKFNSNGERKWCTYYGGGQIDYGREAVVDKSGMIYLSGGSASNSAIATPGSYQALYGGGPFDAFLAKFDSNGVRLWGTYYGGTEDDSGFWVSLDSTGNLYLCGTTNSSNGIATNRACQTSFGGGAMDGFLVKFNSNGERLWGTYYGGTEYDECYGMAVDGTNNVYICGTTKSSNRISTLAGYQAIFGGSEDAFLAKLDSNGVRQWGTYYGGQSNDEGYGVAFNSPNYIYLCGSTISNNAIASTGSFQSINGGSKDAFLVKFNSSGERQWGTYYGGTGYEDGLGVFVDYSWDVYLCGTTQSNNAIATTGAYQSNYGGGTSDAYLAKFNSSGVRQWGTYYGGANRDIGHCIATNSNTYLYLCGYTASSNAISTNNSHQTFIGGNDDAFLVNFAIIPIIIQISSISGSAFCPGDEVTVDFTVTGSFFNNIFTAQLSNASGGFASPVTIGTLSGTTSGTIHAVIPASTPAGSGYRIRVVSSSPEIAGSDNGNNITVYPFPILTIIGDSTNCCANNAAPYETTTGAGLSYQWSVVGGAIQGSSTQSHINVLWGSAGVGKIKIILTNTATGCKDSLERNVNLNPLPIPTILGDTTNCCANHIVLYRTTTGAGLSYQWSVVGGTIQGSATQRQVNVLWGSAGAGKIKIILSTTATGCKDSLERNVIINPLPIPTILGDSTNCCANHIVLYETTSGADLSYQWSVVGGTIQGSATQRQVNVLWGSAGAGKIKIILSTTATGCKDSLERNVIINPLPIPTILGDSTNCCANHIVLYETTTGAGLSYQWSVVGGTIQGSGTQRQVNVLWGSAGTSKIKIILTNTATGCKDSLERNVVINPLPVPDIVGNSVACINTLQTYSTTQAGTINHWTVTGGTIQGSANNSSVDVIWTNTPFARIKLVQSYPSGCKDSIEQNITVNLFPAINLDDNVTLCIDTLYTLDPIISSGSSTLTDISWTPISGLSNPKILNPTVSFAAAGDYKYFLTITDANGCINSDSIVVTIRPQPQLQLSKSSIDFQTLYPCQSSKDDSLTITNIGSESVSVDKYLVENGFTIIKPPVPFLLNLGDSKTIIIRYSPVATGQVTGNIVLNGSPCGWSRTFQCKADKANMLVSSSPAGVDFGESLSCFQVAKDTFFVITNAGTSNITFYFGDIILNPPPFTLIEPKITRIIAPNDTVHLRVSYHPTLDGNFSENIKIPFETGTCNDTLKLALSGNYIKPEIESNLSKKIDFPDLLGCTTSIDTIINVQNTGSIDMRIVEIEPDNVFSTSDLQFDYPGG